MDPVNPIDTQTANAPDLATANYGLKQGGSFNPTLLDGGSAENLTFARVRDTAAHVVNNTGAAARDLHYKLSGQAKYDEQANALYADPAHRATNEQIRDMRAQLNKTGGRSANRMLGIDALNIHGAVADGAKAVDALAKNGQVEMTDAQIREMALQVVKSKESQGRIKDDTKSSKTFGTATKALAVGGAASLGGSIVGGAAGTLIALPVKAVAWVTDKIFGTKLNEKLTFGKLIGGSAALGAGIAAVKSAKSVYDRQEVRTDLHNSRLEAAHVLAAEQGIRNSLAAHGGKVVRTAQQQPQQQPANQPEASNTKQQASTNVPPPPKPVATNVAPEVSQNVSNEPSPRKRADELTRPMPENLSTDVLTASNGLKNDMSAYSAASPEEKDRTRDAVIARALQEAKLQNASSMPVADASHSDISAAPPKTPDQPKDLNKNISFN